MKVLLGLLFLLTTQSVGANDFNHHPLKKLMLSHYEDKPAVVSQKTSMAIDNKPKNRRILLFIFSNQCPYCVRFAPLLKAYASANHWTIEAVSLNGQTLPEFPDALFATQDMIDVAYQGKPVVYPALFIANTSTKALYPVSFGALSYEELVERIARMSVKISEYEGRHS